MNQPLASLIRPSNLDEVVGQSHLLGKNGPLRKLIESKYIPNMIFYGPSGCGKTTIANIIASQTNKSLYKINATVASSQDVREIISRIGTLDNQDGILLYIDEIQYFSKKQQQVLLEYIENGDITLIASTTENPYFYIYNALLSRSTIFEFKSVQANDISKAIKRAISILEKENNVEIESEQGLINYVSSASGGDVRKALNTIELLFKISPHYENKYRFSLSMAEEIAQKSSMKYDRDGDNHYDLLSAFQKSIRGSDPNASVFYLAKLLASGDIISPSRRLLVIAAEDIGLAHPNAIAITKACVDAAFQLGLPEARIPLAEATIFLATCPKSNSAINAIDSALQVVKEGKGVQIPYYLQDAHYEGAKSLGHGIDYLYPHSYPNHYVDQQYLPDDIKHMVFYEYSDNKIEKTAENYWSKLKKY
ncbi:MAG: replication-associated recombination protein A [Bacilli bacterium]